MTTKGQAMKIFLTGGNGNIGSAIRNLYQSKGHEVYAPSSKELDLADIAAIGRYFEQNGRDFDVIVHCAGYNPVATIENITLDDFNKTQNINLTALLEITKQVLPHFKQRQQGYIVGIASLYASTSRAERVAYASSKHALVGMLQTMAIELGRYHILCNSVSPGYVDTQMFRGRNTADKINEIISRIPLGRLATPEDIAAAVYFLGSPENKYISGQDIIVDGGFMAGGFQ